MHPAAVLYSTPLMPGAPAIPPYAVTAWSVCTALGITTRDTVSALSAGASGLRAPPVDLPFETVCGALPDALSALPPDFARFESPVARIVAQLLDEVAPAVARAVARHGGSRVAVVLGTSVGGLAVTEEALAQHHATGTFSADYDLHTRHSLHAAVDFACVAMAIRGPRYAVSTACSSSGKVFAVAQRLLRADVVDAVLVGGVDSLCQTTLRGFHALSVLSSQPCRPFGLDRQGMNLGEGGALFLIERAGEARALVLGVGESADAHHMSSPHPDGHGAVAAMRGALAQAGLHPADVGHVNAHGTGTAKNDTIEARAIEAVFGAHVPVVSTKGATGHTLGAAGAIEAAFAIVALEEQWIPPSLGATPRDPEVTITVNEVRRPLRCRAILSNSFGFGGSNVAVLLGVS